MVLLARHVCPRNMILSVCCLFGGMLQLSSFGQAFQSTTTCHPFDVTPSYSRTNVRTATATTTTPYRPWQFRTHRASSGRWLVVLRGETNQDLPKLGQKQGVYTRPSAAIERGSGFFVPGLEGPRVRLLFGSMLLLLSGINHVLSEPPLPANVITTTTGGGSDSIFAEALAVVYSTLVLLQGAVELRKEGLRPRGIVAGVGTKHSTAGNAIRSYQQQWSVAVEQNGDWRERVEWAASTYLALTPATHVMLVGPGKVVYALGATEPNRDDSRGEEAAECAAALTTLAQSQSGRVSLPPAHPVVTGLTDPNYNRCVVLQRVNAQLCWVVTSDQLLAGFTQQDLQWLGQLAIYIDPESV